ncbi:hypothetical protein PENTCL1PPCAC_18110, partial [Pristionchus entomophagus]
SLYIFDQLLPQTFTDDDNFFLVGGDSFKLLKLQNKLVHEFGLELSLADILPNLTVAQQVNLLYNRKNVRCPILQISDPEEAKGTLILLHP